MQPLACGTRCLRFLVFCSNPVKAHALRGAAVSATSERRQGHRDSQGRCMAAALSSALGGWDAKPLLGGRPGGIRPPLGPALLVGGAIRGAQGTLAAEVGCCLLGVCQLSPAASVPHPRTWPWHSEVTFTPSVTM